MPGECHYLEGNLHARNRVEYVQRLLDEIGLNGRRIQMVNLSAAMAGQFAYATAEMAAEIRNIGPNPLGQSNGVGTQETASEDTPTKELG